MLFQLLILLSYNINAELITFDDINVVGFPYYAVLPRPYKNFIFKKENSPYTGYIDDNIPVLNVTDYLFYYPSNTFYQGSDVSHPNVIFTTSENLIIEKSNGRFFDVTSLYMKSIFINNMAVSLTGYRNERLLYTTILNLTTSSSTSAVLNWNNIDFMRIGCSNPHPATCAHVAYDSFTF